MVRFLQRVLVALVLLALGVARADEPVDLEASSAVLERLQKVLPGLGVGDLHLVGGAALSIAGAARFGTAPKWNDLDVRGVATTQLSLAKMEAIVGELTKDGWAKLLDPGVMQFSVRHEQDPSQLHAQGFGIRLVTKGGLRFDVAVLNTHGDLTHSGYNSAESLIIPLKGEHDLARLTTKLSKGSVRRLVKNGDLAEPHGHAAEVLTGKVVITNAHNLTAEPELQALRFLRAVDKVGRLRGKPARAGQSTVLLMNKLPGLIENAPEVKDPSYGFRVAEQAGSLLQKGGTKTVKLAKRMGLDLVKLSKGELQRKTQTRRGR